MLYANSKIEHGSRVWYPGQSLADAPREKAALWLRLGLAIGTLPPEAQDADEAPEQPPETQDADEAPTEAGDQPLQDMDRTQLANLARAAGIQVSRSDTKQTLLKKLGAI